ncbi:MULTISPECIES: hypothetical protein [Microbacterium]|uniref:hypothetical protein n=1 Tax=Microbacterium TaxID=33882 RepID=UPI00217ED19B|nr:MULTISPECIES: hypothetical protein [Microbacterium]
MPSSATPAQIHPARVRPTITESASGPSTSIVTVTPSGSSLRARENIPFIAAITAPNRAAARQARAV